MSKRKYNCTTKTHCDDMVHKNKKMKMPCDYELKRKLKHTHGLIQYGNFILKSGQTSNIYFDFRVLVSNPDVINHVVDSLYNYLSYRYNNFIIAGVPTGGSRLANVMSSRHNIPLLQVREQPKVHGTQKHVEGNITNQECIIIEDTVTTGNSIKTIIGVLRKHNVRVHTACALLNRDTNACINLARIGCKLHSLFNASDFL